MGTHEVEYDIIDSAGSKYGTVPVTRVTKARGTAIFVTGSSVKRLIVHFMNWGINPDPLSNPETCLKTPRPNAKPQVRITIAYRNGQRRDARDEANFFLPQPPDEWVQPCQAVFPTLLRWAVQTGAVEASSLAELRRTISAPSFTHIEWTHPNRPVLCAIDQDDELQYDSPAQVHHLESYVRAITADVPALHDMKCSALRWGAIYEAWEMGRKDAALAMLDECGMLGGSP
ncbi:uncharacterized protein NECHADRAFT_80706 [Fusarium vanettenii 77-13-4]|uniref:Uncharacterized protein n=1 Tax=Fusarium vanettenii (strain ATCC MYA-4622 / CBS 123669 / FGSC 9596 / NRRL 45880 / 77-13-4) TaxID=660122 RepID=C7YSE2_FUSV7|nr:uncharacterized protein NECHADRAFT_80706 [Fusarium vanettenii 77-13-4]EEU45233.1 predicted protein [Fusarium vanettenii 77-13-4]